MIPKKLCKFLLVLYNYNNYYFQDLNSTAVNAILAIHTAEQEFEKAVEQGFNNIGDTTMKAVRRFLPITKSKFNWSNFGAYRMVRQ